MQLSITGLFILSNSKHDKHAPNNLNTMSYFLNINNDKYHNYCTQTQTELRKEHYILQSYTI